MHKLRLTIVIQTGTNLIVLYRKVIITVFTMIPFYEYSYDDYAKIDRINFLCLRIDWKVEVKSGVF